MSSSTLSNELDQIRLGAGHNARTAGCRVRPVLWGQDGANGSDQLIQHRLNAGHGSGMTSADTCYPSATPPEERAVSGSIPPANRYGIDRQCSRYRRGTAPTDPPRTVWTRIVNVRSSFKSRTRMQRVSAAGAY
jgi:hypothetical protein